MTTTDAKAMKTAIDKLVAQVWRRLGETIENTEDFDGRSLLKRAIEHEWLRPTYAEPWFEQSEVGTVLKTGVSAFERIV